MLVRLEFGNESVSHQCFSVMFASVAWQLLNYDHGYHLNNEVLIT